MQTEKGAGALHAEEKERAKEAREDGGPRPGGKRPLQAGRRGRVAWEGEEKTLRQTEVSPGGGQWGMMASVADYAKEDWDQESHGRRNGPEMTLRRKQDSYHLWARRSAVRKLPRGGSFQKSLC